LRRALECVAAEHTPQGSFIIRTDGQPPNVLPWRRSASSWRASTS